MEERESGKVLRRKNEKRSREEEKRDGIEGQGGTEGGNRKAEDEKGMERLTRLGGEMREGRGKEKEMIQ